MSKARNILPTTIKRLYALSGNLCAFPDCNEKLFDTKSGTNISNICHIEAAEKGGQRYNPASNDDYRRSYDNLILLCANHHKETDNVDMYSSDALRAMKRSHETEISKLLSNQNILSKYPSALSTIISLLGKSVFEQSNMECPQNAPNPDEKISYNNVVRYKPIIEECAMYQGKLNLIYEEIEKQGSTKKDAVLQEIRMLYWKEKGKYKNIDEIRANADNIIEKIENEMWAIVDNSANSTGLDFEIIGFSIKIILVDAFMRCNILEEPPKDDSK
ncbi:MAG: hypothetical protein LBQ31_09110 [Bacteroidales bacterium]|jgi:hypothetical protein|nr:hypothetical protein [Bacteroidales bacterium]